MFVFQRHLQYHPMGKISKISSYNLDGFSEKILTTSDNVKILSWYKPALNKAKLIIYFHGNAGNLGDRVNKFKEFSKSGFGVLAISYRGYSGSEGTPTEAGIINDGETAIKFALAENYNFEDLIFFGESLGSGVAVQLASRYNPYAVILESPYSSVASVGQKTYWFVPVALLLQDKFESIKFAPKISAPVLIFHGTADKVVSYKEGKILFNAINSQKELITVEGAGHLGFSNEFIVSEMEKFFKKIASN